MTAWTGGAGGVGWGGSFKTFLTQSKHHITSPTYTLKKRTARCAHKTGEGEMKRNKHLSHAQPRLGVLNTHSPFYDGGLRMLDVLPFRDAMKLCE